MGFTAMCPFDCLAAFPFQGLPRLTLESVGHAYSRRDRHGKLKIYIWFDRLSWRWWTVCFEGVRRVVLGVERCLFLSPKKEKAKGG